MNFQQRNELCERLIKSGWTQGTPSTLGWTFEHEDGFRLFFTAQGYFTLFLDGVVKHSSVATEPAHILDVINREAAKL